MIKINTLWIALFVIMLVVISNANLFVGCLFAGMITLLSLLEDFTKKEGARHERVSKS
ncbi:hypothetical protein [Enterococcus faecium]|uniref:hypothetical protein n=1 Tax=Enterococcus faecium TaxID=1352 RepID=UPI00145B0C0C|nr:hypothetical protein [Enterococcus faecium]QMX51690.1 hypothetical protein HI828_009975 [Enterococcus faecium]QMX57372.1 hypothetical protein HI834_009970 [Enterococcus faecium]HCR2877091.1 hypothetical protein [Enterococcus faecium]HCR2960614.1 hypothetical protein [Enterococcus faecium]